jgi:hypothetical protein
MPVDDLWYLNKRGPNNARLKSKRYGRGRRWRCRYEDVTGRTREKHFDRKADADAWDREAQRGTVEEVKVDQAERKTTFYEYAERWRISRRVEQALDYRRHLDSRLRHHLYPHFGKRPIRAINVTDVLEWISKLIDVKVAQSSLKTYFDVFNMIMNAALADKVIPDNPCRAVRLSAILRGFSRAPKWVPTTDEVLAMLKAVPPKYRAAIWLGAGEGLRLGEVLGIENGVRCIDNLHGEIHVVQQLRFHKAEYGGFYLAVPKSGSVGDVDLDDDVAAALADHIQQLSTGRC